MSDIFHKPRKKPIFSENVHRFFLMLMTLVSIAGLTLTVYLIAALLKR